MGNCPTIVDLLVSRGQADVDTRNPFNLYAPIHCAAACNNVETIAVGEMKINDIKETQSIFSIVY